MPVKSDGIGGMRGGDGGGDGGDGGGNGDGDGGGGDGHGHIVSDSLRARSSCICTSSIPSSVARAICEVSARVIGITVVRKREKKVWHAEHTTRSRSPCLEWRLRPWPSS